MKTAQSSHIDAHEYDENSRTMLVRFTNGALYQYHGVDANTYHTFTQSNSPGAYFHLKIKNQFESELLSAGRPKRK